MLVLHDLCLKRLAQERLQSLRVRISEVEAEKDSTVKVPDVRLCQRF